MNDATLEIGDKPIKIFENDIVVAGKNHQGHRQLWSLLVFKDLLFRNYAPNVLASYATILKDTNSIYRNNDPSTGMPKSSRSQKYIKIISPIWDDIKMKKKGAGLTKKAYPSAVDYKYYDDPNELVTRLRLLYGSTQAGGDSHRNELVEILTELEERGIINDSEKRVAYDNLKL
jgi:hypothetical protein